MPYHNKAHFFKYVTMDGLRHTTSRLSRQWSSPITFNDPFDAQFDCGFPFTFEDFGHAFLAAMETMVFGDTEPEGDLEHPLFQQIMISRRNRAHSTRTDFRSFFQPTVTDCIPNLEQSQKYASGVWATYLANLRILCLTETNTDLLMWAHYAKHHTGAVLRLGCVREKDSVLLAALPVNYSSRAPYIGTQDEWIRHLTGQETIDYDSHFHKLITTKSEHFQYEKEWRVINFRKKADDTLYMYDEFWPEEIEVIYFGCRAEPSDIQGVLQSMHPKLDHVEIYRAKQKQWHFGLDFERIN